MDCRRVCRIVVTLGLVCGLMAGSLAGQSQENKTNQDDVISLKAHLVTTDVIVKDKKGKYVTDLKAEDFVVFENGTQQRVEFFDPPTVATAPGVSPAPAAVETTNNVDPRMGGKPYTIVSLLLDGQTTELANLKQVKDGTLKYIREKLNPTDIVALFGIGNSLQLLQPFTQDKEKLIAAVERAYSLGAASKTLEHAQLTQEIARAREELRNASTSQAPAAQLQAMMASRALQRFTQLRSQLSNQTSRPVLAGIASICEAQRGIPGKKTLVLFSQGFVATAATDWQVQAAIDIANRSNVVVYIVDSGGLSGGGPQSGALVPAAPLEGVGGSLSTEDRMRASGGENVFDHVRHEGKNREQDILYRIAGNTGGEFLKGTNDIGRALDRIDQDIRARYTLAYYTSDSNFDGGFRKLKVEVRRPEARVLSRPGYYAVTGGDLVLLSPEEKKLLATISAVEASPSFPMFVQLTPFRTPAGHNVVMSIEVPPSAMKFTRQGDHQQVHVEILGVVRDASDKVVSRLGGNFDIRLTSEQYKSVLNNNLFFRQDTDLTPGPYKIELLLRDKQTGKISGKSEQLALPAAGSEFSTSGVVLSHSAVPAQGESSGDPLQQGGVQIRPSPARDFRAADNLIVFFELYNPTADPGSLKPLVRVTITLVKGGKPVTKPMDYMLIDTVASPIPHMTFAKYVSLAGLSPGQYTAVIEAKDTVSRKLVTHEIPFTVRQ